MHPSSPALAPSGNSSGGGQPGPAFPNRKRNWPPVAAHSRPSDVRSSVGSVEARRMTTTARRAVQPRQPQLDWPGSKRRRYAQQQRAAQRLVCLLLQANWGQAAASGQKKKVERRMRAILRPANCSSAVKWALVAPRYIASASLRSLSPPRSAAPSAGRSRLLRLSSDGYIRPEPGLVSGANLRLSSQDCGRHLGQAGGAGASSSVCCRRCEARPSQRPSQGVKLREAS